MTYIALTIGPIYKTLANAKKPKELFASSYIFSYIMREIIEHFKDRTFITPYIKEDSIFDKNSAVGLFHDRFIFQSQEGDLKRLEERIEEVCSDIAEKLDLQPKQVRDYLQFHYFQKELCEDANPIMELSPYLDTQELFFQTTQDDSFAKKLRRKKGDRDNFLTEQKKIVHDLKKLSYNKYFCIVHADGDNMSKAIADKEKIEKVSKELFEYCKEAHKTIKAFGGQTIFAGGDDLLFFAPVVSKDGSETIFDLCHRIGEDFNERISEATLSFGISINYIKHPLYEALEESRALLGKAKSGEKNGIAFTVTKHSGQAFSTRVPKSEEALYKHFLNLTRIALTQLDEEKEFLHSIHHKIDAHKKLLKQIQTKERFKNFFDNNFNESGHEKYASFFSDLVEFFDIANQAKGNAQTLDLLYATLRFVKFIKGDKR